MTSQAAIIEVDDGRENDSAIGDSDISSCTTSIASSVLNYVYENGRRYHSFREGQYLFPNDETEQDRLDMLHHIFRLMLGGELYKAPLPTSPRRILDYGTGTGIYAIDLADTFPSAEVIGIDLSPIQPQFVPPNCKFIVDDVEADWTYSEKFDYIHQRNMVGSISDWDELFQQAYKWTNPGGYIELQEFRVWFHSQNDSLPEASSINRWQRILLDGTKSLGMPINIIEELGDKLKAAGYTDLHEHVLRIPIGAWPKNKSLKEIGTFMQAHAIESVEPLTLALFTRHLGWTEMESRIFIKKVCDEFKDTKKQFYVHAHFIYAQKPTA
ncbi:S-adenosyl-L-methionine-dependent methyltransferase [Paecilomyces variotii]|uniref:S-adenosyl-L-methionine-dependent methyltransferase n=1 Tax=Byssochlamys spectabilis TaxID=264951 RepID=A0A443HL94_BYSSP|nr:S-adenosyl-L-methionine-dependent methyltransferase [Paecilomyces variotii]KAJ9353458.1 hypothetical protein DTO280E4_7281 [Paecilomyces variotii]RWQ92574.1 S-adenosyl-L-methionine-dependent methyltransferase [Paecilomyces variotii]